MKKDISRKITVTNPKQGLERRQELLGGITEGGTFLPKPIDYADIDTSTLDFIKSHLDIEVGGEKVPVYFMSIQKWIEFSKTWGESDEYKDVKMPFITVVRDPDIQPGTNQDGLFDVAGFPTFFYHKVPTFENGREGFDVYKIPQPTSSDLKYHVRFFTNRMQELNKIHNKIQRTFKSRQFYVYVHGHPMPILLEGVNDESRIDEIESRRYYAIDFEMMVNGYILNEDDFEVTPMKDRTLILMEGDNLKMSKPTVKKIVNYDDTIDYQVHFKFNSIDTVKIKMNERVSVSGIINDYNLKGVIYKKNGEIQETLPFIVERNDTLELFIERGSNSITDVTLQTTISKT